MAEAVADINRAIAAGHEDDTLSALQRPCVGLRGVLPERANHYQTELEQLQSQHTQQGNVILYRNISIYTTYGLGFLCKACHFFPF